MGGGVANPWWENRESLELNFYSSLNFLSALVIQILQALLHIEMPPPALAPVARFTIFVFIISVEMI